MKTNKIIEKLLTGTGEIFGTELAQGIEYTLNGGKLAIFTWHGCSLQVRLFMIFIIFIQN